MSRMLKLRISNDKSRLHFLATVSAFLEQRIDLGFSLSLDLTQPAMSLARNFPIDLADQKKKAREKSCRIKERKDLFRTLGYSIRDARMGKIRYTRRHDELPEATAPFLIPLGGASTTADTDGLLAQARDLIRKSKRLKDGKALTNPTIDELTKRLADAESSCWAVNNAEESYKKAQKKAALRRDQVDGTIRQLNYELTYHLKSETPENRIAAMKLYGFKWIKVE